MSAARNLTVVTGGSRGIGAAICRRLAVEGHDVVVGYRLDLAAAARVADDVKQTGQRALVVQVDATDERSVAAMFDSCAAFGEITGLVNSAGSVSTLGPLEQTSLETVRRDLDLNVFGVLACTKYAIGPMAARGGGAIVNISSAAASLGSPGEYVHYAAAKAAVDALTVGLAKELAPQQIRVNAVAPGVVWTDFHADPQRPAKLAASIPLGRAGRPEEIAGAVAWLISPDAAYTTGAVIRVAGGR